MADSACCTAEARATAAGRRRGRPDRRPPRRCGGGRGRPPTAASLTGPSAALAASSSSVADAVRPRACARASATAPSSWSTGVGDALDEPGGRRAACARPAPRGAGESTVAELRRDGAADARRRCRSRAADRRRRARRRRRRTTPAPSDRLGTTAMIPHTRKDLHRGTGWQTVQCRRASRRRPPSRSTSPPAAADFDRVDQIVGDRGRPRPRSAPRP